MMKPIDYFILLACHDWYYSYTYADNSKVRLKYMKNELHLRLIANNNPHYQSIYNEWEDYKFRNGPKPHIPQF